MKKSKIFFNSLFILGLILFAAYELVHMKTRSCGFYFNMGYDDQHAAILDYRLDGWNGQIYAPSRKSVESGEKFYVDGLGVQYERPTSLYVKWQDELTGAIYQDTVNLRWILPYELADTDIYFLVKGSQLSVYLVYIYEEDSNNKIGADMYRGFKNIQLYPSTNN